jgi:hypothetical protein
VIVLPIGDQKKKRGEGLCEFYKGPFWKKKGPKLPYFLEFFFEFAIFRE